MSSRDKRVPTDDDPTIEEEAPDLDLSKTDRIEQPTFVSASHDSSGIVEHDERGQARWKWVTEQDGPPSDADKTFDQLEALKNDRLALEESAKAEPAPHPKSGYDPYETKTKTNETKPPRKRS
jgi:hypothetical protein